MKRPTSKGQELLPFEFGAHFPGALSALEVAVDELLSAGWDELRRRRAHEMSTILCDASKIAGWKETGGILHAITSLLALPLGEILSIREAVRDRLLELLGILRDSTQSETA